jgi:hypothetical protein
LRRDRAEDVGCHHAHEGAADNFFREWASPIAKYDFVRCFLDDIEVAKDTLLEIDQDSPTCSRLSFVT